MNELKFNSQICTTKEQSERLLKLGLKPETADCYNREEDYGYSNWIGKPSLHSDVPAWSLHRLMEILDSPLIEFNVLSYDPYEEIISIISECIKKGYISKEYLNK